MQFSLALLAYMASYSAEAAVLRPRGNLASQALQDTKTGFCLSHYGSDGQLYSKTYSDAAVAATSPDEFSLTLQAGSWSSILEDTTLSKECVHYEASQTSSQFQCSGDSDGTASTSFSTWGGLLEYETTGGNYDSTFYGCGTSGSASSTGINYFGVDQNPGSGNTCYQTTLKFVDPSECKTPVTTQPGCQCESGWHVGGSGCYPPNSICLGSKYMTVSGVIENCSPCS